jgi:ribosome-binding factor A
MKKGDRGTPASQRQLRVGEEIRHALAEVFLRAEFRDPDLAGVSVTVSEVRISPDLRNATAFVLPLGGRDDATVLAALGRASPYLRGELAKRLKLRFAANLSFKRDDSFDEAERIGRLLHDPRVAADLGQPEDDET